MKPQHLPLPRRLIVCVTFWAALATHAQHDPASANEQGSFRSSVIDTSRWLAYVGIADVDSDGRLDITTASHSIRPRVLLRRGDMFEAAPPGSAWDIGKAVESHWRDHGDSPPHPRGVIAWWEGAWLHVAGRQMPVAAEPLVFEGTAVLPRSEAAPIVAVNTRGIDAGSISVQSPTPGSLTIRASGDFAFAIAPVWGELEFQGELRFPPTWNGLVSTPDGQDLVYTASFEPDLDWHALSWADFDGDGFNDVFAAAGAAMGRASIDSADHNDAMIVGDQATPLSQSVAFRSGIRKSGWPGQGVELADIDADGWLDLHIKNWRAAPPRDDAPDMIYRRTGPVSFEPMPGVPPLEGNGVSKWLDLSGHGELELIRGDSNGLRLYSRTPGTRNFVPEALAPDVKWVGSISVVDFDKDGDSDVIVAASPRSLILVNTDGRLNPRFASDYGLPTNSASLHPVDVNNDGVIDVYARPGAVFIGSIGPTGLTPSFRDGHLLTNRHGWEYTAWGDVTEDGRVDFITSANREVNEARIVPTVSGEQAPVFQAPRADLILYENAITGGAWLAVDVVGNEGNHEAIGATVVCVSDAGQERAVVGQADASRRGSGLYRLHFGLGAHAPNGVRLAVTWPNGVEQVFDGVATDRCIVVRPDGRLTSRGED